VLYKGFFKDGLFHGKGDFIGSTKAAKAIKAIKPTDPIKSINLTNPTENTSLNASTSLTSSRPMRIVGIWRHGKPDGIVEIDFDEKRGGGTYRGEVTRGMFSGKGTRVWSNGNIYIGQWETISRISGNGLDLLNLLMHSNDRGTMHGCGSYLYSNGIQYVGEFQHGVRSGSGKQIWPTGHLYVGEWRHDAPHGEGAFVEGTTRIQLCGSWEHGRLIQEIVEQIVPDDKNKNSTTSSTKTKNICVGLVPFQKFHVSVGVDIDDNNESSSSSSTVQQGMQRKQIQVRNDGTIYVGSMWRGVEHGEGIHVSSCGDKRNGPFVMGCSSSNQFGQGKKFEQCERNIQHENNSLNMQKEALRSQMKRMLRSKK